MKTVLLALLFVCSCSSPNLKKANDEKSDSGNLIKVAVLNFKIIGQQDPEVHFKRIEEHAELAKKNGASFLLIPELTVFDMLPINPPEEKMKEYLDLLSKTAPEYESRLKKISIKNKLNIVGASAVVKVKDHYINRSFYISHKGEVFYQDKIRPTPWEVKHGFKGGKEVKTFQAEEFSFVILICHDAEFPSLSFGLKKTRPEVIFVPSQTDDVFGLNRVMFTSRARAVENMSYVLMTGDSGDPEAPWHSYIGQSFLFSPQNKYFDTKENSGPYNQEALSIFSLDLSRLRQSRQDPKQVYPIRDES